MGNSRIRSATTRAVHTGAAIVVGGHINGLGVVRALAARGIRVAVINTQPFDIAHHSRYVVEHAVAHAVDDDPEQLLALLERRASSWRGSVVIPTNDGALAALSAARERLEPTYRLLIPSAEATGFLLDKSQMLKAAAQVGINTPHSYGNAGSIDLPWRDLRYPVVVKALAGYRFARRFGCKLFVASDQADLEQCCASVAAAGIVCDVQELVEGADDQIYAYCLYVDRHGEPSRGLLVHKLRQSPPFFGVARVAEVVGDNAMMREAALALLRRINFQGMASVEFKVDARDGNARFIEVNGRSVIYNGLLRRAGLDLTGIAWSELVENRAETASARGWPGVWINLHADLLYSALDRQRDPVSWSRFSTPYRRPMLEASWSMRDPRPFLAQWARTATEGVSSVARGSVRARLTDRTSIDAAGR